MLSLTTAGESHGPGVLAVLSGVPAGLEVDAARINGELRRRQGGYGRSERQAIEQDAVEVLSGVRGGRTTGAPLALLVRNRDSRLDDAERTPEVYAPRPGHADLAGMQATGAPIRDVLERSSARSTAALVAAGAVAKMLLGRFGIEVGSHVVSIGDAAWDAPEELAREEAAAADASPVRCLDREASSAMCERIDEAGERGESLGGVFELRAWNVPAGLGSYTEAGRRLDRRLAAAVMAIPAVKGVEIGAGFSAARMVGSEVHDSIKYDPDGHARSGGFSRETNRAGGIEGGVTNGQPVVVRAAMKPIPTLGRPLQSVDIRTLKAVPASKERSDVCAVPAASVVGEAAVALILAEALLEKLGTGSADELDARFEKFIAGLRPKRRG